MTTSLMTFDQVLGISTIALQSPAGESIFTYTHSTKRITAPARGAIDFDSMQTAKELHEALQRWIAWLSTAFADTPEQRTPFEESMQKRATPPPGQIDCLYEVGGTRMSGQWDRGTGHLKFKPRLAMNWKRVDFEHFLQWLSWLFREIGAF